MSNKNKQSSGFAGTFLLILLLIGALTSVFENDDETQKETKKEVNAKQEVTTALQKELTEQEYKAACKELFYDDVFFGKEDLEGKYVKLNVFLTKKYYFTIDDTYKSVYQKHNKKYNLNRDFYDCSVLRKEENSYAGKGKIYMWFSDNYTLNPNDFKVGDKITVYAEVVSWSDSSIDGFNELIIIPKYIEK